MFGLWIMNEHIKETEITIYLKGKPIIFQEKLSRLNNYNY
jgi:hypothetical protein